MANEVTKKSNPLDDAKIALPRQSRDQDIVEEVYKPVGVHLTEEMQRHKERRDTFAT